MTETSTYIPLWPQNDDLDICGPTAGPLLHTIQVGLFSATAPFLPVGIQLRIHPDCEQLSLLSSQPCSKAAKPLRSPIRPPPHMAS